MPKRKVLKSYTMAEIARMVQKEDQKRKASSSQGASGLKALTDGTAVVDSDDGASSDHEKDADNDDDDDDAPEGSSSHPSSSGGQQGAQQVAKRLRSKQSASTPRAIVKKSESDDEEPAGGSSSAQEVNSNTTTPKAKKQRASSGSPRPSLAHSESADPLGDDDPASHHRRKLPSHWFDVLTVGAAFAGKNLSKQLGWALTCANRIASSDSTEVRVS